MSGDLTGAEIAARLDVAALAPGTTREDVRAACREARDLGCASVCVPPVWVSEAVAALQGSEVAVGSVVGFPSGGGTTLAKVIEALECIKAGAVELDVVIAIGLARSGDYKAVRKEVAEIVQRTPDAIHKFILEMGLLTGSQLRRTVKAVAAAGPAFLKSGTGTIGPSVTAGEIEELRALTPPGISIKAAGGIRTHEQALALVAAGADRLGTSTPRGLLASDGVAA